MHKFVNIINYLNTFNIKSHKNTLKLQLFEITQLKTLAQSDHFKCHLLYVVNHLILSLW